MIYQPITQQGKIHTAIDISKTDVLITEKEQKKVAQQTRQSVERLYYGLLINQKQKEEAVSHLEAAKIKLFDVESALMAGKTVNVDKAGLQADIADEEQRILQLDLQAQDYMDDLKQITGLNADNLFLANVDITASATPVLEESKSAAFVNNVDIDIANLYSTKAELGIKAARQSYLPDVGIRWRLRLPDRKQCCTEQQSLCRHQFKWNIQDVLSNRHVVKQRQIQSQQANENLTNTREQLKH
jgi:outer membrane protein TolC